MMICGTVSAVGVMVVVGGAVEGGGVVGGAVVGSSVLGGTGGKKEEGERRDGGKGMDINCARCVKVTDSNGHSE